MTILKEHRAIIRSLENHDKSLALEMMKKHIETQKQIVKQMRKIIYLLYFANSIDLVYIRDNSIVGHFFL